MGWVTRWWGLSPVALVNYAKERGLSSPLLSSTGGLGNPPSVQRRVDFLVRCFRAQAGWKPALLQRRVDFLVRCLRVQAGWKTRAPFKGEWTF